MRFAICNADLKYSENLKKTIYTYAEKHKLDIYVECFANGKDILNNAKKYNLLILSENLLGENGFTVIERVRKEMPLTDIIFESEHYDRFLNAFKINPYRFLLSPITPVKLTSVLDEYFEIRGNDYPLWIKSGLETYCLNTSEIVYLEADNKHCHLQLDDRRLSCNKTMARVFNVLPKNHFIKIHRAFVVNSNYINYYNRDNVYLKNGDSLHISRHYYKEFKEEYKRITTPMLP